MIRAEMAREDHDDYKPGAVRCSFGSADFH